MNRLFPLPLYTFLKTVYQHGGVSAKGWRNVPAWLLKLIVFEPLRWLELTYNDRIERHTLSQDPVFILGYYRSGTSFLHEFLSQDDRFGYHTNFQMIFPDLMLGSERYLAPFFDFLCRIFDLRDPVHRIQMSFKYPGEEDGAMSTALNPRAAALGWFFPQIMLERYRQYAFFEGVSEADVAAWAADYQFLLRKVSLASNGKPLILKSPPNTARIKLLLSLFPRAKFIFIHRNPYDVYASNQRFWQVTNRIYALGSTRSVDFNGIILDTYAGIMERYLRDKNQIPAGQLVEVAYADLMQAPLKKMEQIYAGLRLPDFAYCKPVMQKYLEGQKSYVRLQHVIPPDELPRATRKLEPFLREWGYPVLR